MSLKILGKKAFVLFLLFLAMACVYMVKNDAARESYFNSFKSIAWRADIFKGLSGAHNNNDIKIDLSDINMDSLTRDNSKAAPDTAVGQVKASESKKDTLENIEEKIKSITAQTNNLEQEVNDLVVLNQIQQQIKQISEKVNSLSNEISQFSVYGY